VVNAASVVCSDATSSEVNACNVGYYLANGTCTGTVLHCTSAMAQCMPSRLGVTWARLLHTTALFGSLHQ
jgi:hypothetical protein